MRCQSVTQFLLFIFAIKKQEWYCNNMMSNSNGSDIIQFVKFRLHLLKLESWKLTENFLVLTSSHRGVTTYWSSLLLLGSCTYLDSKFELKIKLCQPWCSSIAANCYHQCEPDINLIYTTLTDAVYDSTPTSTTLRRRGLRRLRSIRGLSMLHRYTPFIMTCLRMIDEAPSLLALAVAVIVFYL